MKLLIVFPAAQGCKTLKMETDNWKMGIGKLWGRGGVTAARGGGGG